MELPAFRENVVAVFEQPDEVLARVFRQPGRVVVVGKGGMLNPQ
jgi:hypothetical protein